MSCNNLDQAVENIIKSNDHNEWQSLLDSSRLTNQKLTIPKTNINDVDGGTEMTFNQLNHQGSIACLTNKPNILSFTHETIKNFDGNLANYLELSNLSWSEPSFDYERRSPGQEDLIYHMNF